MSHLPAEERVKCLVDYETKFHAPIWKFMMHKTNNREDDPSIPECPEGRGMFRKWAKGCKGSNLLDHVKEVTEDLSELDVLDISEDACVFTQMFANAYKVKEITTVVRDENKQEYKIHDNMIPVVMDLTGEKNDYSKLKDLGKFDIIVLKEVLYQITNLTKFMDILRELLKPDGIIFVVWRPSLPPLPIPNAAMPNWKKMAPAQEDVLEAANEAGLKIDAFAAACPIVLKREEWEKLLLTCHLPVIRNSPKCTPAAIKDFISKRPETMKFEERLFVFVFWVPIE